MNRWNWSCVVVAALFSAACDAAPSIVVDGGADTGGIERDGGALDGSHDAGSAVDARVICRSDADCDDGMFCNGPETCAPAGADADVHGCVAGATPCTAPMVCSESADACTTSCGDGDHDGHTESSCGGDDCDDADAAAHPGATEVCNAHDDDCDGTTDEGVSSTFYADADADGFGDAASGHAACAAAAGEISTGGDCDDADATIHPSAAETCDDRDQDCDGRTDEGVTTLSWPDSDGDGFGAPGAPTSSCAVPVGSAARTGDCDDSMAAIHPTATELCNGVDDDCNGLLDGPSEDLDGDGAASQLCGGFDCDDHDASSTVGMAETCNGIDDDCDSRTDEGTLITSYRDADGDGYGVTSAPTSACIVPAGYATMTGDCDDGNPAVSPGVAETCNVRDDDCDTRTDEGVLLDTYRDADGDAHGTGAVVRACTIAMGYAATSDDCDDTRSAVYPGAPDLCDRLDDDCVPGGASDDLDADGYLVQGATCSGGAYAAQPRTDCDDAQAAVHPGAAEVCNGRDDDCDGTSDGAPATAACAAANAFNATSTCGAGGTCATVCTSGWTDCDGAFNGCETVRAIASTSCGTCGLACAPGQVCASSACATRYQTQRALSRGAYPYALASDASGNVYVTGNFSGAADFGGGSVSAVGSYDVFVASYSSTGAYRWSHTYGTAATEAGRSIAVDASGNVYVAGNIGATNVGGGTLAQGGFLASYTSAGVHRWSRNDGWDARGVTVDASGNVTVIGFYNGPYDFGGGSVAGSGYANIYAASYSASAGFRWARGFTASISSWDGNAVFTAATDTSSNVYFTVGGPASYNFGGGGTNPYTWTLVSLSNTGTYRWQKTNTNVVATDNAGNVYTVGYEPAYVAPAGLSGSGSINVYSSAGGFVRAVPYVGATPASLYVDSTRNLYVGGRIAASVGWIAGSELASNNLFVASFDATGAPRWSFGAPVGDGSGTVIAITTSGSALALASSWGGGFSGPVFGGPRLGTGGLVWWTP